MHDQIVLNVVVKLLIGGRLEMFAYSTLIENHLFFRESSVKHVINIIDNNNLCATVKEYYDGDLNPS